MQMFKWKPFSLSNSHTPPQLIMKFPSYFAFVRLNWSRLTMDLRVLFGHFTFGFVSWRQRIFLFLSVSDFPKNFFFNLSDFSVVWCPKENPLSSTFDENQKKKKKFCSEFNFLQFVQNLISYNYFIFL